MSVSGFSLPHVYWAEKHINEIAEIICPDAENTRDKSFAESANVIQPAFYWQKHFKHDTIKNLKFVFIIRKYPLFIVLTT